MFKMRTMKAADFDAVAELIFLSTNAWYQQRLGHAIFQCRPQDCRVFCEVYNDLDPEGGLVLEHSRTGMIVGSCFFHPRETHVSLGIMNVHPNYFGHGIAGRLLERIIDEAESRELPLRLVSSALNLDSYSLYNRHGFVPFCLYQDLFLQVPEEGISAPADPSLPRVREAAPSDLVAMGRLEFEVSGISRERDYCYFIENSTGIWKTFVSLNGDGEVDGFLNSIDHPAIRIIGPGVMKNEAAAEALLRAQLDHFRGKAVVFLLPAEQSGLVRTAYGFGARNCELHLGQVRGDSQPVTGIAMPTFLPESA
ncbi:MAG: GNAT family N-acetyltransferase [Verrucomicrobiaceae bacterium]|nr:GNAT family N-acetyltransferase [Verrucomicrobiaceae bacterium]